MSPRCGRVMRRCEAAHGALPEAPRCGRPAGHNGPHRSRQALAKAVELERRTWAQRSALRRERARQAQRRAVLAEAATAGYRAGWDQRRRRAVPRAA